MWCCVNLTGTGWQLLVAGTLLFSPMITICLLLSKGGSCCACPEFPIRRFQPTEQLLIQLPSQTCMWPLRLTTDTNR